MDLPQGYEEPDDLVQQDDPLGPQVIMMMMMMMMMMIPWVPRQSPRRLTTTSWTRASRSARRLVFRANLNLVFDVLQMMIMMLMIMMMIMMMMVMTVSG